MFFARPHEAFGEVVLHSSRTSPSGFSAETRPARRSRPTSPNENTPMPSHKRHFCFPRWSIGTCSYAAASDYPADVVVDHFSRGLFSGVRRVKAGTRDVVTRLTNNVSKLYLGHWPRASHQPRMAYGLSFEGHEALHFDHVVLATQANQALDPHHAGVQERVRHPRKIPIRIKPVTDASRHRACSQIERDWSPVNFIPKRAAPNQWQPSG